MVSELLDFLHDDNKMEAELIWGPDIYPCYGALKPKGHHAAKRIRAEVFTPMKGKKRKKKPTFTSLISAYTHHEIVLGGRMMLTANLLYHSVN